MSMFFIYVLNAMVVAAFVAAIAHVGDPARRRWLRGALFALLVATDMTCLLWFDCSPRAFVCVVLLFAATAPLLPDGTTEALDRALGRSCFAVYLLSVATVAGLAYLYLPITTF